MDPSSKKGPSNSRAGSCPLRSLLGFLADKMARFLEKIYKRQEEERVSGRREECTFLPRGDSWKTGRYLVLSYHESKKFRHTGRCIAPSCLEKIACRKEDGFILPRQDSRQEDGPFLPGNEFLADRQRWPYILPGKDVGRDVPPILVGEDNLGSSQNALQHVQNILILHPCSDV